VAFSERMLQVADAHRRHLEKRGVPYRGARQRSGDRSARVSVCWSCHFDLDSSVDVECAGCGWMICLCGACGCARLPNNSLERSRER
jgi:hypothetical protein